jgi:hypothetical protein
LSTSSASWRPARLGTAEVEHQVGELAPKAGELVPVIAAASEVGELGRPGDRRRPSRRARRAELAGMLVVESSSAAGHQVGGDHRRVRARRHARGRARARARRLATRSAAIAGAAELAGLVVMELELGGWSSGRRRSPARPSSPLDLVVGVAARTSPTAR